MALLHMFKNRKPGSTLGRICDSLFNSERRRGERKNRRLLIDQLEERTLLSVYTPDLESNLVNIAITQDQGTVTASSLAMDKDGDFVVVWSRVDPVLDAAGDPVIDPATGQPMTDENIYARYMTKEVQQLALPAGVLNYVPNSYAKMSIRFGGNEIQQLSFGATTASGNNAADLITGTFQLSYVDGGGIKHTTAPITFNEADFNTEDPLTDPAMLIQDALRLLGGDLEDVVVKGINSQNFTISFGDASGGQNINELFVENASWTTGFLSGAFVKTVSEPFTIENITISPTNPYQTAMSIEDAFEQYYKTQFIATDQGAASISAIVPTVEVTPVKTLDDLGGLRTFNIEFTGDASYQNVPTLVIEAGEVLDANGVALNADDIFGVTLKETGDEFRVNPEEPDSPFTQLPDKFNQSNPSVAMNAEGNFVIVWESEVPESQGYGSVTDIFARMYQAVGVVNPADNPELNDGIMTVDMDLDGYTDTAIQGVRLIEAYQPYSTILEDDDPLRLEGDLYTFRANVNTSAAQGNPSVGMDAAGNFTIAWSDSGQEVSFFNTVNMRQFSYDGTPQSAVETAVNYDNTEEHDDAYVAMSDDGYALIIWSSGATVFTAMYDPDGYIYQGQSALQPAAGGSEYSAYFDSANNYAINWTVTADNDWVIASSGVYFVEYTLDGGMLRGPTRANSGSTDPGSPTTWFHDQYGGQIVMDADGDLTVAFSGYGPDANGYYDTAAVAGANAYLQEVLARDENADLIALWPDLADFAMPLDGLHSGDIDGEIEEVLIFAQKDYGFDDEQLGRLRTIMETIADLSRGEASGVMFSQFDADPTYPNPQHVLISDSVVNSQRDGNNARMHLALDNLTSDGTFVIEVRSLLPNGGAAAVEVEPAYVPFGDDQIIDPMGTIGAIQDALDSHPWLANNCAVRIITPGEMDLRDGTYWELDWDPATQYVYEITFQGTLHDCPISFNAYSVDLVKQVGDDEVPADPPVPRVYVQGNPGTYQQDASIGMTPEGDFAVAYTEYNLNSVGEWVASNIYYRYYDATDDEGNVIDTAGPTVTSVETPDGVSISQSPIVYQAENVSYIVLTMSEAMYDNLTGTGDAVTNPENYRLSIGGEEVEGAISQVYYGLSEASNLANKAADDPANWGDFSVLSTLPSISYEIVLVVDSNGLVDGTEPMHTGNYFLELLAPSSATLNDPLGESGLRDASRNRLNRTGFNAEGSNTEIEFTLVVENDLTNKEGLEVRVNETTDGVQTTSVSANEEFVGSTRCVAIDNDGDFVVVWVSEDQDGDGAGVYMRRYNNAGNPLSDETLVNTTTTGDQLECAVAMDADGDFVVVWSSESADGDGSWDIYGQRFDSMGRTLGEEFRVNSNIANHQVAPAIAMDSRGNFVVAWASQGQDFSYFNDIRAQVYNSDGQRLGNEIRVNSQNIPGALTNPSSNEVHPSVSVSETGRFVVSWTAAETQKNGVTTNAIVMARVFDFNGNALTIPEYEGHAEGNVEFRVNVGDDEFIADYEALANHRLEAQAFLARNAQVTMNRYGEFIVVWEAWQDNDWVENPERINSYGIYYRQYNLDGTPKLEVDTQANQVVTALAPPPDPYYSMLQSSLYFGDQYSPSIAVDADGDFFITWSGNGSSTDNPLAPQDLATAYDHDQTGVFVRSFHATLSGDNENPPVTPQTRVNTTDVGEQSISSIAVTPSGTYVVVWSGKGGGDSQGVYFTYHTADTDTAGPMVTDFLLPDGTPISETGQVTQPLSAIVITFDEDMYDNLMHNGNAITNPDNYDLLKDGISVVDGVSQVFFGLDMAYQLSGQYGLNAQLTNKFQAVLIVDANGASPGTAPLTDGQYQVVVSNALRDLATNPLQSTGWLPNGGLTSGVINVTVPTGQETRVANDITPPGGKYTSATTADAVAADADGDYVVAWTDDTPGREGVWFKMYGQTSILNADGTRTTVTEELEVENPDTSLPWANNEVLVSDNPTARDISVARDIDGDFVVTWSQWSSDFGWDVYAQMFDNNGQSITEAFRVNATAADMQHYSSVAMDAEGNFLVTWQSNAQDGSGYGIYAQRYDNLGNAIGSADESQYIEFLDDFTGSFQLRWDHDNNPLTADRKTAAIVFDGDYEATALAIQNALTAIGAEVEVYVDTEFGSIDIYFVGDSGNKDQAPLWVHSDDVIKVGGGDDAEVSVVTWNDGASGEFLVNDTTVGDQMYPDVAMDAAGNCVITWTAYGQGGDTAIETNIYAKRLFVSTGDDEYDAYDDTAISEVEFIVNANDPSTVEIVDDEQNVTVLNNEEGNQSHSSVAMDLDGDFVITWTSYGHDVIGNGYGPGMTGLNGVFARRFTAEFDPTVAQNGTVFLADPAQASNTFQVNQTGEDDQQNARVAMDADGDFIITWESDQNDTFDIFIRRYAKTDEVGYTNSTDNLLLVGSNPYLGSNGEMGGEVQINTTTNGDQRFPSITMDDAGDAVIVWSGNGEVAGQEDSQGIFSQRLARPADDAGPTVSGTTIITESGYEVAAVEDITIYEPVTQFIVTFGEELSTVQGANGVNSVLNPDNWLLTRGTSTFCCQVVDVEYGYNEETGKFEAIIFVDGNRWADDYQALGNGTFTLTLSDNVRDLFGNYLDGDYDGVQGGAYSRTFTIDLSSGSGYPGDGGEVDVQYTSAAHSLAADNDGDFVIVYTRDEPMMDTNGDYLYDPATGDIMYGSNIYAKYHTETVQRLTLPEEVLYDVLSNQYAHFSLVLGGNEVQKITLSQATSSLEGSSLWSSIDGTFKLWFDRNEDGMQDGGEVTETIEFHEMAYNSGDTEYDPAIVMQAALRGLGGELSDVVVTATDADNYLIQFGDASNMEDQPTLMIVDPLWESGFLPAATVSTVSEPIELGISLTGDANIPVSPSNGALTAAAIEQAFLATIQTIIVPPMDQELDMPANLGPYEVETSIEVIVTPVYTADDPNGLRTFDITFVDVYENIPLLVTPAGQVVGESGVVLAGADVEVKKESSDEFRVNPEVPINEFQLQPDVCYDPSVAMDADGSFVISWTAVVSDWASAGSETDIFARRFEPAGMVANNNPDLWVVDMNNDGVIETSIQGVRPVEVEDPYNNYLPSDLQVPGDVYTFRVNTDTTNDQGQSSVAMDSKGNFTIVWVGVGQDTSFFNSVKAQRYSYDGTKIGYETMVNNEITDESDQPYVAISENGYWMVVWHNTARLVNEVLGRVYDPEGNTILNYQNAAGPDDVLPVLGALQGTTYTDDFGFFSPSPTVAFNAVNDFIICWSEYRDNDNTPPQAPMTKSLGVYVRQYNILGEVIRTDTRVNSALAPYDYDATIWNQIGFLPDTYNCIWPGDQGYGQVVIDADGDVTVSYEGFGPAVTEAADSLGLASDIMAEYLYRSDNADLLDAFPELASLSLPYGTNSSGDPDSVIEEVLIEAQKYHGFTDDQLGRLSAIMNSVITLLRGEANGVMYTQYDADPRAIQNILAADNVVNTTRDGTNTRWVLSLIKDATSGAFQIRITNGTTGRYQALAISPVYTDGDNPVVNAEETRKAIENALKAAVQEVGINWPTKENSGNRASFDGPVTVRMLSDQEVLDRQDTYWDLGPEVTTDQYVYEVTFMGEVHNTGITIEPNPSNPRWNQLKVQQGDDEVDAPAPVFVLETSADWGTDQYGNSIAMTPDGSFIVAWTQDTLDSTGLVSSSDIMYRIFTEEVDTAGPSVANWHTANGEIIEDGGTVYDTEDLIHVVVSFDEAMYDNATHTGDAVTNPSNYVLWYGEEKINGAIVDVKYGMNMAADLALLPGFADLNSTPTNHWEVVLTIDPNGSQAGNEFSSGDYILEALAPALPTIGDPVGHSGLRDRVGNALGRTGFWPDGHNYDVSFNVSSGGGTDIGDPDPGVSDPVINTTTEGDQETPVVASDAEGNYIVAWVSHDIHEEDDPDSDDPEDVIITVEANIRGQLFDKDGRPVGQEFVVNSYTLGEQIAPDVAMDNDGNFVVVWSGQGQGDQAGVYGRTFDSAGQALSDDFRVNTTLYSFQDEPSVAMDADGDFVVTWTSYGQDGDLDGTYARRYSLQGVAKAGEILVNTNTANRQDNSDVAMDDSGNFVVVWRSDQQDGNSRGIFGQRFTAAGAKSGGEFAVNTYTLDDQIEPSVAMDADGDFVVAWSSMGQDGDGYGVYARRYGPAGVAKTTSEFQVNQTALHWQVAPDVAMRGDGMFVVTWSSFGHDNLLVEEPTYDYGVFGRVYNANGTNYNMSNGAALGEFRLNGFTEGNQFDPAVTFAGDGKIVGVWTGPDKPVEPAVGEEPVDVSMNTDIFSRIMSIDANANVDSTGPTISQVVVNTTQGVMTWNATDSDGIKNASVKIGGVDYAGNPVVVNSTSKNFWTTALKNLPAGTYGYTITATDTTGDASQVNSSFTIGSATPVNAGPTIGQVSVNTTQGVMTWNATDSNGINNASVKIGGVDYAGNPVVVNSTSSNFWTTALKNLPAGTYGYTITATDKLGNASQKDGSFQIGSSTPAGAGPEIKHVVVNTTQGVMTWNATDANGIKRATVRIGGVDYAGNPVVVNSTSSNFWTTALKNLPNGTYNYTITAEDKVGDTTQKDGAFQIGSAQTVNNGPVIGSVVVSQTQGVMTWNATDANGIAGASVMILGVNYAGNAVPVSATSSNFWTTALKNLPAGTYGYTITATDKLGNDSQVNDSFTLTGSPLISPLNAPLGGGDDDDDDLDWVDGDGGGSDDAVDVVMADY